MLFLSKLIELAEELKVVGNNMRSLEVSEQEAKSREDGQAEQIRDMGQRLKDAEERADLGEKTISTLQKECDRLEGIFISILKIINIFVINFDSYS